MKITVSNIMRQAIDRVHSSLIRDSEKEESSLDVIPDGSSEGLDPVFTDSCNSSLQLESSSPSLSSSEVDLTEWGHDASGDNIQCRRTVSNYQVECDFHDEQFFCLQELADLIPNDFLFVPTNELSILQGAANYVQYLKKVLQLPHQEVTPHVSSWFENSPNPDFMVCPKSIAPPKHSPFYIRVDEYIDDALESSIRDNSTSGTESCDAKIQDDMFNNYVMPACCFDNSKLYGSPALSSCYSSYILSDSMDSNSESCSGFSGSSENMDANYNACMITSDTMCTGSDFCSYSTSSADDSTSGLGDCPQETKQGDKIYNKTVKYSSTCLPVFSVSQGKDGTPNPHLSSKFSKEYPVLTSLLDSDDFDVESNDSRDGTGKSKDVLKSGQFTDNGFHKSSEEQFKDRKDSSLRRPKNGFIRFSVEYRKKLANQHPKLDNREVSKMLGAKWRKMSREERKPYEVQFESDIKDLRQKHPEWRYAPLKRLSHDLIEPMPSRLRPRDTLKRKFLPTIIKYGPGPCGQRRRSHHKQHKHKVKKEYSYESYLWLQCNLCSKWRYVTCDDDVNIPLYRTMWFCHMNPDKSCSSCFDEEDWRARHEKRQTSATFVPTDPVCKSTECSEFSSPNSYLLFRKPNW